MFWEQAFGCIDIIMQHYSDRFHLGPSRAARVHYCTNLTRRILRAWCLFADTSIKQQVPASSFCNAIPYLCPRSTSIPFTAVLIQLHVDCIMLYHVLPFHTFNEQKVTEFPKRVRITAYDTIAWFPVVLLCIRIPDHSLGYPDTCVWSRVPLMYDSTVQRWFRGITPITPLPNVSTRGIATLNYNSVCEQWKHERSASLNPGPRVDIWTNGGVPRCNSYTHSNLFSIWVL